MSTSVSCPFCGELMDSPLRFCVACGRAITQEDMKRAGLKMNSKRMPEGGGRAEYSKKDFSGQRKMRNFLNTTSAVLVILMSYYVLMKYVLHAHMPGNIDVKIEELVNGHPSEPVPSAEPATKSSSTPTANASASRSKR